MLENYDFPSRKEDTPKYNPAVPIMAPLQDFATLKVTDELMVQYQQSQTLLQNVMWDDEVAPNQKAQVMNTITAILAKISAVQMERYTAERLKHIENILLKVLKTLPTQAQTDFLEAYSHELGEGSPESPAGNAAQQPGAGEPGAMDRGQNEP